MLQTSLSVDDITSAVVANMTTLAQEAGDDDDDGDNDEIFDDYDILYLYILTDPGRLGDETCMDEKSDDVINRVRKFILYVNIFKAV